MKRQLLGIILSLFICGLVNAQVYMYGTTYEGGANNLGTIYRVDHNGQNFEKLFDFTNSTGGKPTGGLTLANNGKLYGFTNIEGQLVSPGAQFALGSFFEFDPLTNNFQVIEYIDELSDIGHLYNHRPLLSASGLLYCSSMVEPGDNILLAGSGKIWSYDVNTTTTQVLDSVVEETYGIADSKLMEASDGHIYFTTKGGVGFLYGAVVRFNTISESLELVYQSLGAANPTYEFEGAENNALFEGSDGFLYGASSVGGNFLKGNLFKIDKNGSNYQTLHSFNFGYLDQGWHPVGGFVEKDGFLYSATKQHHIENQYSGTFYKIEIATGALTFTNFLDLEGIRPQGTFVESPNGRFYITCSGYNGNNGSIVEFNPLNQVITQRHLFIGTQGKSPIRDGLSLVDISALSVEDVDANNASIELFPNPSSNFIELKVEKGLLIKNIDIYDIKGSLIKGNNSITNSRIDISKFTNGVYLINIDFENGKSLSKKFIVKN